MDYKTAVGMLRPEERDALVSASTEVDAGEAIINIGVEYGASMVCLAKRYRGELLIGIDQDLTKLSFDVKLALAGKANWVMGDSHDKTVQEWVKRMMRNENTFPTVMFIDGDHTYEGVLADAQDYIPMTGPGSLIIFHDCFDYDHPETGQPNPNAPDVNRAVQAWFDNNGYDWEELDRVGTMRLFRRRS